MYYLCNVKLKQWRTEQWESGIGKLMKKIKCCPNGKVRTHYHKRRGLNENVVSNKDNKNIMALGEYQMCQSHFSPRQFCGIFKPPQIFEVYPLTLIPCRKGNWSHVGSTPTSSTRSRVATLIVGRVTEPMIEVVSLPPKEVTNKVSELPMVRMELEWGDLCWIGGNTQRRRSSAISV